MEPSSRRLARQAELAEALWNVILERGVSAVSVRSVADRAGLAVGSLRHVFPTRTELIVYSAELMLARATERISAIPLGDSVREYAIRVLRELLPLNADTRAELEVNLALFIENSTVPEMVEVRNAAHEALLGLCRRLVQRLSGRNDDAYVEPAALRLHALLDGLALHLLQQPLEADASWAVRAMHDEVDRLIRVN